MEPDRNGARQILGNEEIVLKELLAAAATVWWVNALQSNVSQYKHCRLVKHMQKILSKQNK